MKATQKPKKKKSKHKVIKVIIITLLSLIILSGVAICGVVLAIINTSPELDVNQILSLNETSKLYDSNGQLMDNVVTDEIRTSISLNDMPKNLKNAFISIEDERFADHPGIDVRRIGGVVVYDIKSKLKGQTSFQGASTITQQLIKNTVLTSEVTLKRKIQEMYLALELEKKLSKNQILEAYLNTIPLGGKINGVEAASEQFFSKRAKDLTLTECAYISGVTQNPSRFYPFQVSNNSVFTTKSNLIPIINRTKTVLVKMRDLGKITKEEYDKSIKELDTTKITFIPPKNTSDRLIYEWFSLPTIEQVRKDLKSQYNYSDKEINSILMYSGIKIYTTMDRNLQDAAQKIIDDKNNIPIRTVDANGIIEPQASAVIMDYHSGEVKTIIGGRGAQPARSLNRAAFNGSLEVPKSIGSSIKPLTVYGPAIDTKNATAATVIEDSPLPPELAKLNPTWIPRNYSGDFSGFVNIREAIKKSINLVAIKLEYAVGLKTGATYGDNFGLQLTPADKSGPSPLALGEISGSNTLTMAAAYGTFGNNGLYTAPKLYTKVQDRTGKILLETKTVNRKVLSPQAAFIMYNLLTGPTGPGGTAPNARFSNMPVSGKTGTTGEKINFWFAGLTPYYSGSVWIGDDKPRAYTTIGSDTSAGVWAKIMAEAHKNLEVKDIAEPSGIVRASVCRDSGKLPTEYCSKGPTGNSVYTEMFLEGSVPTTFCDVHVALKINKSNNKLASEFTPIELIVEKVFLKRISTIGDNKYAPPTEVDDTKPVVVTPPTVPTPTDKEVIQFSKLKIQKQGNDSWKIMGESTNKDTIKHTYTATITFYDNNNIVTTCDASLIDLNPGETRTFTATTDKDISKATYIIQIGTISN